MLLLSEALLLSKMNSVGRVTKRLLERENLVLKKQLQQKSFKLFIVDEQKRQLEEYSTYLEDIISAYKFEESMIEETRTECTQNTSVIEESKEEKNVSLPEEKKNYWQCFWCLTKKNNKVYSTHTRGCYSKYIFRKCYQNESLKCSKCYGVKIVFEPSQNVLSELCATCNVCCSKLRNLTNTTLIKHVKNHHKYFSFFCSCTEKILFNV